MAGVTTPKQLREKLAFEIQRWFLTSDDWAGAEAAADSVIASIIAGTTQTTVAKHPIVKWIADHFMVDWYMASAAILSAGTVPFTLVSMAGPLGSNLLVLTLSAPIASTTGVGFTSLRDGGAHTFNFDSFVDNKITFITDDLLVGEVVTVSYSQGAGDTLDGAGTELSEFTDQQLTVQPGELAFVFGASLYMASDGALNSTDEHHIMQAQAVGRGTPAFDTPAGLLLPDHLGTPTAIPENSPPWHGARWDNGVAYSNDGPGGNPLDPSPSLFASGPFAYLGNPIATAIGFSADLTNHANNQGAYYVEFDIQDTPTLSALVALGNSSRVLYTSPSILATYDGSNFSQPNTPVAANTVHKAAVVYDAVEAKMVVNLNGAYNPEQAYDGAYGPETARLHLLSQLSGVPLSGSGSLIKNIRRYDLPWLEARAKIDALMV